MRDVICTNVQVLFGKNLPRRGEHLQSSLSSASPQASQMGSIDFEKISTRMVRWRWSRSFSWHLPQVLGRKFEADSQKFRPRWPRMDRFRRSGSDRRAVPGIRL